ncbi:MAG: acyloxyacyl hydrolase [Alphaproteobacteria bacterium]|nr:acyloxyacyl hydrolase [Alphaproteobacteria bacterium]
MRVKLALKVAASVAVAGFLSAAPAFAGGGLELRGGVLAHDAGLFSGPKEDGIDINAELLFPSPDFLGILGSPRPHIGGNYSVDGISFGYAGLAWDWDFLDRFFVTASFGGAIHDADYLTEDDLPPGVKESQERLLGCQVLFHLALGVGYQVTERVNVHLYADHISNATLCDNNEGLENAGARVGIKF